MRADLIFFCLAAIAPPPQARCHDQFLFFLQLKAESRQYISRKRREVHIYFYCLEAIAPSKMS